MTPLGLVSYLGALVTVGSLWRHPARSGRAKFRAGVALVSWGALWFATASSFAREGMSNLPDHMIGHIIVMFLVPIGLVLSGAARQWWWLVPVGPRRRILRWFYRERRWRVPRWVANPVVAALVMNVVMVSAHVPGVFDAVMSHQWAMDWLMEPPFLLSGLFFFHYLIASGPRRPRARLRLQLAMVAVTMAEMLFLAMSMAIFTTHPWYSVRLESSTIMPGMEMAVAPLTAFHQQQLAAGILWICGDFWAVPIVVMIARRIVARDGGLLEALERQFSSSGV